MARVALPRLSGCFSAGPLAPVLGGFYRTASEKAFPGGGSSPHDDAGALSHSSLPPASLSGQPVHSSSLAMAGSRPKFRRGLLTQGLREKDGFSQVEMQKLHVVRGRVP